MALFFSHIRPILYYCSCVRNVDYEGDLGLLETLQTRWTKNILGIEDLDYREKLRFLNLFSNRGRLLRADLIKYCKDQLAEVYEPRLLEWDKASKWREYKRSGRYLDWNHERTTEALNCSNSLNYRYRNYVR